MRSRTRPGASQDRLYATSAACAVAPRLPATTRPACTESSVPDATVVPVARFDIVDLTQPDEVGTPTAPNGRPSSVAGQGVGNTIGSIDTTTVAAELESLRQDLNSHIRADNQGLHLTSLCVKLTLSAEGRVAFIAKGAAEACIEVTFSSTSSGDASAD
jgi:hypothetical protein